MWRRLNANEHKAPDSLKLSVADAMKWEPEVYKSQSLVEQDAMMIQEADKTLKLKNMATDSSLVELEFCNGFGECRQLDMQLRVSYSAIESGMYIMRTNDSESHNWSRLQEVNKIHNKDIEVLEFKFGLDFDTTRFNAKHKEDVVDEKTKKVTSSVLTPLGDQMKTANVKVTIDPVLDGVLKVEVFLGALKRQVNGEEVSVLFRDRHIRNSGKFFTDSNGLEMI